MTRLKCFVDCVDQTSIDNGVPLFAKPLLNSREISCQPFLKPTELRPIGVQSDAKQTNLEMLIHKVSIYKIITAMELRYVLFHVPLAIRFYIIKTGYIFINLQNRSFQIITPIDMILTIYCENIRSRETLRIKNFSLKHVTT